MQRMEGDWSKLKAGRRDTYLRGDKSSPNGLVVISNVYLDCVSISERYRGKQVTVAIKGAKEVRSLIKELHESLKLLEGA